MAKGTSYRRARTSFATSSRRPGASSSRSRRVSDSTRFPTYTRGLTSTRTRTVYGTTTIRGGAVVNTVMWATDAWRIVRAALLTAWKTVTQTVTPAGVVVVACATVGLGLGLGFGWTEWVVTGLAAAVIALAAIPFLLGQPNYDVSLEVAQTRVVAGGEVSGHVRVRNAGRRVALPGRLDVPVGQGLVEFALPLLLPERVHEREIVIPAYRRGIVQVGPVLAVRRDPVGVLRREIAWEDVHELYVHPKTVTVPSTSVGLIRDLEGSPTRQLVDADVSFHAIREYVPGDSRRQIHWKSTAKTGQLMVRQYEESMRARIAVVLSCAREEYLDDDEYELAVSVAASMSVQGLRDGRDVEVIASAEVPDVMKARVRSLRTLPAISPRTLLDGFCEVELVDSTMPLREVCRLACESEDRVSLAVLVCGSPVDLRSLRQAALAFPADAAVLGIVCDERSQPSMAQFGSLVVLTVGVLGDLGHLLVRGVQG